MQASARHPHCEAIRCHLAPRHRAPCLCKPITGPRTARLSPECCNASERRTQCTFRVLLAMRFFASCWMRKDTVPMLRGWRDEDARSQKKLLAFRRRLGLRSAAKEWPVKASFHADPALVVERRLQDGVPAPRRASPGARIGSPSIVRHGSKVIIEGLYGKATRLCMRSLDHSSRVEFSVCLCSGWCKERAAGPLLGVRGFGHGAKPCLAAWKFLGSSQRRCAGNHQQDRALSRMDVAFDPYMEHTMAPTKVFVQDPCALVLDQKCTDSSHEVPCEWHRRVGAGPTALGLVDASAGAGSREVLDSSLESVSQASAVLPTCIQGCYPVSDQADVSRVFGPHRGRTLAATPWLQPDVRCQEASRTVSCPVTTCSALKVSALRSLPWNTLGKGPTHPGSGSVSRRRACQRSSRRQRSRRCGSRLNPVCNFVVLRSCDVWVTLLMVHSRVWRVTVCGSNLLVATAST